MEELNEEEDERQGERRGEICALVLASLEKEDLEQWWFHIFTAPFMHVCKDFNQFSLMLWLLTAPPSTPAFSLFSMIKRRKMFSEKLPLSGERPPYLWSSVFFAFSVFLHKKAPLHIEMVKEESTFHAMQPQQKICIGLPIQSNKLYF